MLPGAGEGRHEKEDGDRPTWIKTLLGRAVQSAESSFRTIA
jgi:hypothetical protein